MKEVRFFHLSSGYKLAYSIYGISTFQRPVFFFHGFPGSRLEGEFVDQVATELGLSIVTIDRPGFGRSDYIPERSLLDWPSNVLEVARSLGIEKFSVLGLSGGCPYTLACAFRLPREVTRAITVSGLGPIDHPDATKEMVVFNRLMLRTAVTMPVLANLIVRVVGTVGSAVPESFLVILRRMVPWCDKQMLSRPGVEKLILRDIKESLRQRGRGAIRELAIFSRPWGFDLAEIKCPVTIWHGEADSYVPCQMARWMAAKIPGSRANYVPGGGHFMIVEKA
ncbi:MAG: hypothetical protein DCC75_02550, partial [Proteobacteria bacterium]